MEKPRVVNKLQLTVQLAEEPAFRSLSDGSGKWVKLRARFDRPRGRFGWIDIVSFDPSVADKCRSLTQHCIVDVAGALDQNSWEATVDGKKVKRYTIQIIAYDVTLLQRPQVATRLVHQAASDQEPATSRPRQARGTASST